METKTQTTEQVTETKAFSLVDLEVFKHGEIVNYGDKVDKLGLFDVKSTLNSEEIAEISKQNGYVSVGQCVDQHGKELTLLCQPIKVVGYCENENSKFMLMRQRFIYCFEIKKVLAKGSYILPFSSDKGGKNYFCYERIHNCGQKFENRDVTCLMLNESFAKSKDSWVIVNEISNKILVDENIKVMLKIRLAKAKKLGADADILAEIESNFRVELAQKQAINNPETREFTGFYRYSYVDRGVLPICPRIA